jgi:hypothetical protein
MPVFNKTIEDRESGISDKDTKIDTTPNSQKEQEEQDKALLEVNDFNDTGDTSPDSDDSDDSDEEETEEKEKSKDDEESDEDDSEDEEKESDEDEEDEETEEETPDESKPEWEQEGYKTPEEYIAHLKESKEESVDESKLSETERANVQKNAILSIADKYSDILPKTFKENYVKFYETNSDAFLHLDNHLHKFVQALDKTSERLSFKERCELAAVIAFRDELSQKEQKKGEVRAEIRTQKVNKSASSPVNSSNSKKGNEYSKEAIEAGKKMGWDIVKNKPIKFN